MSQRLPRFNAALEHINDQRKIGRILQETGVAEKTNPPGTAGGDHRRLRGIPVIARGVGGTSPGTQPEAQATR